MARETVWEQVRRIGVELGSRFSNQEHALRNARAATTALSRARVERDAVELYLEEREDEREDAVEERRVLRQREGGA